MKAGFTLLELIFTIVIIAIVSSIAVPKFLDTRNSALATTIKSDINSLITSIQTSYLSNGKLEKVSDAITLNKATWNIENKKVIFKDKEKECIILEVLDDEHIIKLTIHEQISTICTKINELGVTSQSYQLY